MALSFGFRFGLGTSPTFLGLDFVTNIFSLGLPLMGLALFSNGVLGVPVYYLHCLCLDGRQLNIFANER